MPSTPGGNGPLKTVPFIFVKGRPQLVTSKFDWSSVLSHYYYGALWYKEMIASTCPIWLLPDYSSY